MQKRILMLGLLFVASVQAAQVYEWVDSNGVTHFSNQAVPGAKPVDLNSAPYSEVKAIAPDNIVNAEPGPVIITPANQPTVALNIDSPANQATYQNTGDITVQFTLSPSLYEQGGQVALWVDGASVATVSEGGLIAVQNLPRGTHVLELKAYDKNGEMVGESQPVTVYVHRPTKLLSPSKN
jgi:hypothetical protein